MATLRERMIGLPLQRSIFDELQTTGALIGLARALPDGHFEAQLDVAGSLLVNPAHFEALQAAFPERPDQRFLDKLEAQRRTCCAGLIDATGHGGEAAAHSDPDGWHAAAVDLLQRLADFIPYAILTKFVPDMLWRALATEEREWTPSGPGPSPGLQLTLSLEGLLRHLAALGMSADAAAATWPEVPEAVALAVAGFCSAHAGFGPVAWDGIGYDSPHYTLWTLRGLETEGDSAGDRPPEYADLTPDLEAYPMTLAGILEGWVVLTDLQIWYVRTAFYHGLLPLLVKLSAERSLPPESLLFVSRHELAEGAIPPVTEIMRRMRAYWADEEYLARNGVATDRLQAMFQEWV
jgi:hypothetical protein